MKRKQVILLLTILASSIIGVIIISKTSNSIHDYPGPFDRRFADASITPLRSRPIAIDKAELVSAGNSHIYLWSSLNPFKVIDVDRETLALKEESLMIRDVDTLHFFNIEARLDSPYFYLADGTVPYIYRCGISDWECNRFMYDSTYFLDIEPLTSGSFALRSMVRDDDRCALLLQSNTAPHVVRRQGLLSKQKDGCFCTDGLMNRDPVTRNLVYTYFYRNEYLVLDTNLYMVNKGRTIDTFNIARIETAIIQTKSSISYRLASPAFPINKRSYAAGSLLYILSTVRGRNEERKIFETSSVIDIYDTKEAAYQLSFYVPDRNGNKLNEFLVEGHEFIALFGNEIVIYDINELIMPLRQPRFSSMDQE